MKKLSNKEIFDYDIKMRKMHPNIQDAAQLLNAVKKARASSEKYIDWMKNVQTVKHTLNYLENYGDKFYGIFIKERLVGMAGFQNFDQEGHAEISYWLVPKMRGYGIAGRAITALEKIAFVDIGFEKLELGIMSDNIGSIKLAQRLGYELDYSYKFSDDRSAMSFIKNREMWQQSLMLKNQGLDL